MVSYPPTSPAAPFGRYMIRERIARGGMGEVFRAVAVGVDGFEKPVVIKRLLPKFAGRSDLARLFASEAKLMTRLVHPNIVQVIDFGRGENEDYFLVMELVRGVDVGRLAQWHSKRNSRIPLPIILFIVSQVLRGLAYAHATFSADGQRLVHRDISPGNVLVSTFGEVKVADFGVALVAVQADGNVTTPGLVVGKPGYIAPEQFGCSAVDERADLYSLGALFFESITGQLPVMEGAASPSPGTESAAYARSLQGVVVVGAAGRDGQSPQGSEPSSPDSGTSGKQAARTPGQTGSTPGEAAGVKHFAQQLSPQSIRLLREAVPDVVADIVIRALATSPDERYADARSMGHALASLAAAGIASADADDLAEIVTQVAADEQANAVPVVVLGAGVPDQGDFGGTELTRSEGVGIGHFTIQLQTESSVHSTNAERPRTVRLAPVDTPEQAPPRSERRPSDPGGHHLRSESEPEPDSSLAGHGSEPDAGDAKPEGVLSPLTQGSAGPSRHRSPSRTLDIAHKGGTASYANAKRRRGAAHPKPRDASGATLPPPSGSACDEDPRCSWSIIPPSCAPSSASVSPESCAPPFSARTPDSCVPCASDGALESYVSSSPAPSQDVDAAEPAPDGTCANVPAAHASEPCPELSPELGEPSANVAPATASTSSRSSVAEPGRTDDSSDAAAHAESATLQPEADRTVVATPPAPGNDGEAGSAEIERAARRTPSIAAAAVRHAGLSAVFGGMAAIGLIVASLVAWRSGSSVGRPGTMLHALASATMPERAAASAIVVGANRSPGRAGVDEAHKADGEKRTASPMAAAPTKAETVEGAPVEDAPSQGQAPSAGALQGGRAGKAAAEHGVTSGAVPGGYPVGAPKSSGDVANRATTQATRDFQETTAPGCQGQLHVYASHGWILEGGPGAVQAPGRYEWPCGRYSLSATSRLDASRVRNFSISVQSGATSVVDLR